MISKTDSTVFVYSSEYIPVRYILARVRKHRETWAPERERASLEPQRARLYSGSPCICDGEIKRAS
jgi:hypothetical protein